MDAEQAPAAVQTTEAAPNAGAENTMTRAQEKAEIMSQLLAPQSSPAVPATQTSLDATQAEAGTHAADAMDAGAPQEKEVKNFRGRWDHLDDRERRVVKLVTKRGLTLTEAYHAVYGSTPDGYGTSGEAASTTKQAAELPGDGSPGNSQPCAVEQSGGAEGQGESDAGTSSTGAQWNAIALHESSAFPEAAQPGTELHEACLEEYQYLREAGSPLVNDPQCAQKIISRMARLLGSSKPGQGSNAAPQVSPSAQHQPPPVAAKRSVRPVPAGGNPVEAPVQTLERKVTNARTTGEMLALMREFGTPIEALMRR